MKLKNIYNFVVGHYLKGGVLTCRGGSAGVLEEDDSEDGCSDLKRSIHRRSWRGVQHSLYFL